ncbi:MAG: (2Fe-2S)-binding protein [Deltaproteobacteria bacterium]|nr:(2Fe-2S)-binding protein [Deltaproteobacteria bacterium]
MKILLNGRSVTAFPGETVLAAATRAGVAIPRLCHHEAVEASGACRLCMVEIRKAGWDPGWTQLVTACLFPVEEGLAVLTDSPEVRRTRREILELLLARAPEAQAVRDLALEYGIEAPPYPVREGAELPDCILCGLCTRICQALVTAAITTSGRGPEKRVGTPFGEAADACIGCRACASSCPTRAIPVREERGARTIWGRTFALVACPRCGAAVATREHIAWLARRTGRPEADFEVCVACKTKATGEAWHRISF